MKLELIEVKEAKQIAEHHRDRYKSILDSMYAYFKKCCPKDWERYVAEHSIEDIYDEQIEKQEENND